MDKLVAITIALFFALTAATSKSEVAPQDRGIKFFRVIPGNCIIKSRDLCETRFHFAWQLLQAEEACVFMGNDDNTIFCSGMKGTEIDLILAVGESQEFTLRLTQVPRLSLTKHVRVLEIGKDVRVRRRHLWSFL